MPWGRKKYKVLLSCQCGIEGWRPYSSTPASIVLLKCYRPDAKRNCSPVWAAGPDLRESTVYFHQFNYLRCRRLFHIN